MSDDEGFLARWSRRKRRAATPARDEARPANKEGAATETAEVAARLPEQAQPLVDPATLPTLESIGAGSDVSAFLSAGVPAELTRAALRRAWSADPAVRDFIGLSENSWDFTAAGAMPGFGPLDPADASRLLAQAMGEPQPAEAADAAAEAPPEEGESPPASVPLPAPDAAGDPKLEVDVAAAPEQASNAAVQNEIDRPDAPSQLPQRRRGGAVPKWPTSLE